jgi:nickel-dependent lactate racemase
MSDKDRIHGIVAGAHEIAHRRGTEICKAIYGVPIHEKAEIVIAEAYPTDIDLRQAIKAICSADLVCRNGGVVILPAECREGVSPQFPEFAKYGFSDPEKLFRDVDEGNFPLKLMAYTLVAIGRIISNRIRAILVTPNISKSQIEEMGFLWAGDLQSAFDMALGMVGKDGKVAVMRQAGELLPLVNSIQ